MLFCSANFGTREITYGSEDSGDLSLRDACLGKPRSIGKISFISSNIDSRCGGDSGKEMKGGHKEGTEKTKGGENPLCSTDGHPPHWKVWVHPGEYSREQSQVWKLSKCKLGQSLTKWLTVVINEKLREWIQNHPPVQVPSLNISEHLIWILISRGLWIAVHHCAKRKKTSIICVANLHSLPWNITSKAREIRYNVETKMNLQACIGNRWIHDAGKPRPSRKAAAAAAAAAAILRQYIREQSQMKEKERILREDKIRTMIPGWHTWRRHWRCLLRHHDRRDREEGRATYWAVILPVLRTVECTKS